jgi:CRP-like cAMP-binding protein
MASRLLKQEKIDLLARLPLFETCTKKELGQIASLTVEIRRKAGAILTRQGQIGGVLFIIVDGQADVIRNKRRIKRLGPGDVVGELSLIDGQARSADVVATTDVHLLELANDDFETLVRKSPKFVRNLLCALSARIREMDALAG